jgi:hypothetical protein
VNRRPRGSLARESAAFIDAYDSTRETLLCKRNIAPTTTGNKVADVAAVRAAATADSTLTILKTTTFRRSNPVRRF